MKKTVFFITLYLFLNTILLAQWTSKGPYGGAMYDVEAAGSMLYAGTGNGVYLSTDNGSNWQPINNGLQRTRINAITVNGTQLVAGSENNGVYFSSDNGNSWTAKNNGLSSPHILSLFATANGIFAGTPDGAFFTSNNGNSWTFLNNGIPTYNSIYTWAQMGDTVYAGVYANGLWMTDDDGASWSMVGNGFPFSSPAGPFVYGLATQGNTVFAGTSMGIYISTDRGVNWSSSNTGMPSGMWAKTFAVKPGYVFAGTHSEGIFVSTDNGASWSPSSTGLHDWPKNSGLPHNYETINAMAVSGPNILAASLDGMHKSSNNGTSWMDSNNGILATDVTAITTNGSLVVAGTEWTGVFVSSDKGQNWTSANTGLMSNHILAATNNMTYFFVSAQNSMVFRSNNNGASWTQASNGLMSTPAVMDSYGQDVYALTQGSRSVPQKLYRTTDNGDNWTEINTSAISGGMSAIEIDGSYIYVGTFSGSVYRTNTNGATWQDISVYMPVVEITAILSTSNALYVGTLSKGIFKFTNNGATMSPASAGITNNYITDIKLANGILLASTWGGGVFASANEGGVWMALNDELDNTFVRRLACENLKAYAATDAGAYQTDEDCFEKIAILSGIKDQVQESSLRFYPNPSEGMIHVVSEESAEITVYDVSGKKIYHDHSSGSYPTIDLSNQAQGIYLLEVKTNTGSQTKKVLIH